MYVPTLLNFGSLHNFNHIAYICITKFHIDLVFADEAESSRY